MNDKSRGHTMNAQRTQAEKSYKTALATWNKLASGTDLAAWEKADAELAQKRTALIAAETAHPTFVETKRANNLLRLRNRGLDV